MGQTLTKGGNAPLPGGGPVRVEVGWASGGPGLDVAALLVTATGKVRSDEDLVFYNQPRSTDGTVRHAGASPGRDAIEADLARLPADVDRVVITASVDATAPPGITFAVVRGVTVAVAEGGAEVARFAPDGLTTETALVLLELYRRQGVWKVRAVGQGFASGLAGLATAYGISVADEQTPGPPPVTPTERPNLSKPLPTNLPVDLAKRLGPRIAKANVVLEKKGLAGVTAQVALVVDCSGSMTSLFDRGTVALTVERVMALAERFDDDGSMDVWLFADGFSRLPALPLGDLDTYVNQWFKERPSNLGLGNSEPPVIKDVLAFYTNKPCKRPGAGPEGSTATPSRGWRKRKPGGAAAPGTDPAFVVFLSDGSIDDGDLIKKVLTRAADHPIFWQFVGISDSEDGDCEEDGDYDENSGGDDGYGILRELDSMPGRRVDNAGFFALDDIDSVSDEELYDRLLAEFPRWRQAARAAGILAD